jgi:hypothetical protein
VVNDGVGNTCPADLLITNPNPPPASVCPAGLPADIKKEVLRRIKAPLFGLFDPFVNPNMMGPDGEDGWQQRADQALKHVIYDVLGEAYGRPSNVGGPVQFRPYGSDSASGAYAGGDVAGTRSGGYRVTDTAGAFAPNSLTPDFRSLYGGGGVNITADGARLLDLNANQSLLVGLTGDYHYSKTDYGTSPLTPGVTNAGSVRRDIYTVASSVNYAVGGLYVSGRAAVDWSHADVTNNIITAGAQGDTKGRGYNLNVTVGNVFPLFGTTAYNPAVIVKAPRRTAGSGYGLFLDLSGHYGYRHERDDGFTDSTGFVYGTEQLAYSYLGARARLIAAIPDRGFAWMPFVGVTVDRQLGFSHTFDIPAQAATTADTLLFTQANTFWGVEAGLDILTRGTAKFGAKAFYQSSSDTHTTGGSLFVKIPLWDPPAVAPESGIRIARSK